MFWVIVAAVAVVSFLLSLNSLSGEKDKREIENARKKLHKDKIAYQASSSGK
ncbi:MAG: hypothetical protein HYU48_00825 [Candidatus Levybacteria bacterium]|nr:hypothetical protein [Candidatus Levybacteria bacterium]